MPTHANDQNIYASTTGTTFFPPCIIIVQSIIIISGQLQTLFIFKYTDRTSQKIPNTKRDHISGFWDVWKKMFMGPRGPIKLQDIYTTHFADASIQSDLHFMIKHQFRCG